MKIAFFTNFINHHQVYLADELYKSEGVDYTFVATEPLPDAFRKSGYPDYSSRPYLLNAYQSDSMKAQAMQLAFDADVVIIGSASDDYVIKRIKAGKLTFRYSERWFKDKPWYLSGPRAWMHFYMNHIRFRNKPLYMLAASAYTANDVYTIGAYKNKVFKWGYFTKVSDDLAKDGSDIKEKSSDESTSFMWCSRFLDWKHPELPVLLAQRLKKHGYKFTIDMYGGGEEFESIKRLISDLKVADVVNMCGNMPNEMILKQMRNHDIFLFTSDRNEGWGAVLNEAMSCGCAVVSSNLIGATPFLIEDEKNGLVFESENIDSLFNQSCKLIDDKLFRMKLSKNAIHTMQEVWCPKNAAKQLLNLIAVLQGNNNAIIPEEGPCSRVFPYSSKSKKYKF